MQANLSYDMKTPSTNWEPQDDPVYSIIPDHQTTSSLSPGPPKQPPDRTPYYQETESDQLGADHEMPIKSEFSPQSTEPHAEVTLVKCKY